MTPFIHMCDLHYNAAAHTAAAHLSVAGLHTAARDGTSIQPAQQALSLQRHHSSHCLLPRARPITVLCAPAVAAAVGAGGAFVAGHALMYIGTYAYWLYHLAKAGISCSILSVEYPLAPEHPFPAAVQAAASAIEWLVNESGETAPYIVGE